ncbi:hypothetical protein ACQUQU_06295 [Thalassolituus sp. LLYu03]|uniref:hypothetical protein n=1 Tax=Thalassolituus sp. LLYu03 TaxID=3421656 RepID=UPI003D2D8FB8
MFRYRHRLPLSHGLSCALAATALLTAPGINAEIREIPAEEMTEAYIRDTTVIVRKKEGKDDEGQSRQRTVTIKPLEQGYNEGENLNSSQATGSGGVSSDSYQAETIANELAVQSSYNFTVVDPSQAQREETLRQVLGLEPGTPIDYNNLSFPTDVVTNTTPPAGVSSAITPGQFSISIPNSGNYQTQNFQTPGGEYQVNVTPSQITFTLNLPQQ